MSRGVQGFKQTDVAKAIRAALSAGLDIQRFEIDKAGKIVVTVGQVKAAEAVQG